jgi:hypothetical protein
VTRRESATLPRTVLGATGRRGWTTRGAVTRNVLPDTADPLLPPARKPYRLMVSWGWSGRRDFERMNS